MAATTETKKVYKTEGEFAHVNAIRVLTADTVNKANSGHPGAPMGMAAVAHVLWSKALKFNPKSPKWMDRDRFVLSNGHGCALLYCMLHLTGYDLGLDDLKRFRQLDSRTPGHPEADVTPGVEVTTGPLGQGIANGVGLAIAERHLAATFNKPDFTLIDNYTFVFCGDGCLQEGVSAEALSLAGHLGLGKLIIIYDDNKITIDGATSLSFTEDVNKRMEAYGWHTQTVADGNNDLAGIEAAIAAAKAETSRPSFISLKTIIGYGATKEGTEGVHGAPLGADLAVVKTRFGFDPAKSFEVPAATYEVYRAAAARGAECEAKYTVLLAQYATRYPAEHAEYTRRVRGELPSSLVAALPRFTPADKPLATRQLSHTVLNALAGVLPELIGGSADLTHSNLTDIKGGKDFQAASPEGRYIRFGVREHGMAAIGNGLHAYGGLIPYTATFLNFIEYAFPAVRLSALSQFRQIYVMTHDSIGLGEDGPTHQPIEALAMCRATPNLAVFRPADGNETSGSYLCAVESKHTPSVIALTRQPLPQLAGSTIEKVKLGAYVLADPAEGKADLVIVASGSEVALALEAARLLTDKKVRVVSMPSATQFDQQPAAYRRSVLPVGVPIVSIEALTTYGWERYSHVQIGMRSFGASAPIKDVMHKFGFTPDQVVATIRAEIGAAVTQAAALGGLFPSLLATHLELATPPAAAPAHA